MGDQTNLKTAVETLAAAVNTLQATAEANAKAIQALSAEDHGGGEGVDGIVQFGGGRPNVLFTGGLLPPLSIDVRIQNPQSLAAAVSLARQLELREQYTLALIKPATRGLLPTLAPRLVLSAPPIDKAAPPAVTVVGHLVKRLSQAEQKERRRLGLCYNCNEKYTRGQNHVCGRLFYISDVEIADLDDAAATEAPDTKAPVFSLHAVTGVPICDIMQISMSLGATTLVVLLDTGSTHNFIAKATALRIGLLVQPRPRLTATVANGERVTCLGVFRQAPISIDDNEFHVDLFVMPLAGYDLLFYRHGRAVCWMGVVTACTWVPYATAASDSLLDKLLASFGDVFIEPKGLPPKHAHDHSIVLKPGVPPVAVRPYRYLVAYKDELQRQCAAIIRQGIVCCSDSAFSTPVILVKKVDGSWQFCVDYHALNALTVKDAFPILVIDELLDELHGTQFFTKLDLQSGYHQVRMQPENVHKTAFRTHDGLHEFLLFVKRAKCAFGVASVAYLSHVISATGVAMDPTKVQAVHDWPIPLSARANEAAAAAFDALKAAVTSAPILAMPDFTKMFVVECDASSHGFSTRPYLWDRQFLIKTDHYSLKYLLDQRLASIPQHHWVGKLLGFDFSVEYKARKANTVANALSRHDKDKVRVGSRGAPWVIIDDMVQFSGHLYIPLASSLVQKIMVAIHEDGHEGVHRTLHWLRRDFNFPNMKQLVQDFVRACATCQRYKSDHLHPVGLVLPLLVPHGVWTDITLDFVEALPHVQGKSVILMVIDRFSKYCHFIPLAHPYSAEIVAQAFFANIICLHGVQQSLVFGRDPVFTSNQMGNRMPPTTSSSCTYAASQETDCDNGCGGYHGRSSSSPPPTRLHYGTHHSASSTGAIRHPSCRMNRGTREWPPLPREWKNAKSSSPTSATGWSRRRQSRSFTMTKLIAMSRIRWATGRSSISGSPSRARLHDVFHVGLFKKFQGLPPDALPPLPPIHYGAIAPEPDCAVRTRLARGVSQVLIQWKVESAASATC
uniref:Integrase catalytic domain-containing protein n=1 Tax=Oryza coarctata TaxID=77588 RepID=A0A6C0M8R2_ORYCO|nr:hypothetical protein [Oryza coarctata]